MTKQQRKRLADLMQYCNAMGAPLDGTATPTHKYVDRQRALMLVYKVIYFGVFCDDPENHERDYNIELAEEALQQLKALSEKEYKDRNNN